MTSFGLTGVGFGPAIVTDHTEHGYLAVPVVFGYFPPAVGFPNFLGVAFADLLDVESSEPAKLKNDKIAARRSEGHVEGALLKSPVVVSCHVYHTVCPTAAHEKKPAGGNKKSSRGRIAADPRSQLSASGKSMLIGGIRV